MAARRRDGGAGLAVPTLVIVGAKDRLSLEPSRAVAAAVYLHGLASEIGARELCEQCLIATDLLDFLPAAIDACANVSDPV